jgi:hypothetical protein
MIHDDLYPVPATNDIHLLSSDDDISSIQLCQNFVPSESQTSGEDLFDRGNLI